MVAPVIIPSRSQAPDDVGPSRARVPGLFVPVKFPTLDGALLALGVVTASSMSIRSRALVGLVLAATAQSCAWVQLPHGWPMMSEPTGRPVALVPEGSAFNPTVRALTARALEEELDRPVRTLDAMPTPSDEATRVLAERVVGRRSLRYDWREPQCTWDRTLLAGITLDVDAVYRVAVEYSERERMATDAEWE